MVQTLDIRLYVKRVFYWFCLLFFPSFFHNWKKVKLLFDLQHSINHICTFIFIFFLNVFVCMHSIIMYLPVPMNTFLLYERINVHISIGHHSPMQQISKNIKVHQTRIYYWKWIQKNCNFIFISIIQTQASGRHTLFFLWINLQIDMWNKKIKMKMKTDATSITTTTSLKWMLLKTPMSRH